MTKAKMNYFPLYSFILSMFISSTLIFTASGSDSATVTSIIDTTKNHNELEQGVIENQKKYHRRLDRPETVVFKPKKEVVDDDDNNDDINDNSGQYPESISNTKTEAIAEDNIEGKNNYEKNDEETNWESIPEMENDDETHQNSKKHQCLSATSCGKCQIIAQILQNDADEAFTCVWNFDQVVKENSMINETEYSSRNNVTNYDSNVGYCKGIYKTLAPQHPFAGANMKCESAATTHGDPAELRESYRIYGDSGDDSNFGVMLMGITIFFIAMIYMKRKLEDTDGEGFPGMEMISMAHDVENGKNGSTSRYPMESVPLSSAREDEWGWEEDGFQNSGALTSQRTEEEDMQMALALSLSQQSNTTNNNSKPTIASTSSEKQNNNSISRPISSINPRKHDYPSSGMRKPTQVSTGGNSLSSSKLSSSKPNTPNRDVFASVGLSSSKPNFGSNNNAALPTATTTTTTTTTTSVSKTGKEGSISKYSSNFVSKIPSTSSTYTKSNVLDNDEESVGTNPNWEDDDDLDDLLGD